MTENLVSTLISGGTAGIISGLLLVIILLLRGVIVPGYIYQSAIAKLTKFEDMAFTAMAMAEKAARTAKDGQP